MTGLYDAIVVGGGPSGATTAYFLGEAGWRVLVLEKDTLPRYKACGGGLSARMLTAVFPFSFETVIETRVTSIRYAFGRQAVTLPVAGRAVSTVMRDQFDGYLLARARAEVRSGSAVRRVAELSDRVRVELADGSAVEGRWLIGADGANSVVAHALGLRRRKVLAAALEAEVPARAEVRRRLGDTLHFLLGEIRFGYAWIFPKAAHLSVGIAALRPPPGELQAGLAAVAARYGLGLQNVPAHGHPIPIYTGREPIATTRALLVGDAAGLADPLSGEGIRLAIHSGRLAAQALLASQVDQYPARVWRQIGRSQTLGLRLAWLFYHFPGACFVLGARNPLATPAFVEMLAGRADYRQVALRLFATLPLFLTTEAAAGLARRLGRPESADRLRAFFYAGWTNG